MVGGTDKVSKEYTFNHLSQGNTYLLQQQPCGQTGSSSPALSVICSSSASAAAAGCVVGRITISNKIGLASKYYCIYGGLPFFLEFDTSQSAPCTQPRVNEPLELKKTQTKNGNTKYSQSTTILFSTLFFIHHFFETTQFESQEKK